MAARALDTLEGVVAGVLLGLLVYSYTGSRLLGPLLAAALAVFAGRGRWRWLLAAWGTFAVLLLPLGVYALRHPGALTARYEQTTIARDGRSSLEIVLEAIGNWFKDANPWHWATAGDPAPYVHNGGYGALFAAVVALAIAGAVLVLVRQRGNLWWRYVLVAMLLVPIPAALTVDRYNALRLSALPVFVLTLAIPAIAALVEAARTRTWARVAAGVLAVTVAFQFAQFLDEYRTRGPGRVVLFEAGVEPLLDPVLDDGETIYVDYDDRGAQVEARWHAVERGIPASGSSSSRRRRAAARVGRVRALPGVRLRVRGVRALGGVPARTRRRLVAPSGGEQHLHGDEDEPERDVDPDGEERPGEPEPLELRVTHALGGESRDADSKCDPEGCALFEDTECAERDGGQRQHRSERNRHLPSRDRPPLGAR